MICEPCAKGADYVPILDATEEWSKAIRAAWHGKCKGCECLHRTDAKYQKPPQPRTDEQAH